MFGAICGDTIGSTYEFDNTKDYGFELFPKGSSYTDDSVMTLAVAKWLLTDAEHTHGVLEKCMVELAEEYPCPVGGYGGMFREWLFRPRAINGRNGYPVDGKRHPYGSWGNGSAMRASACGWFFDTLEETERVAGISASITHDHPEGIKGAQAVAAAIFLARTGHDKAEIKAYVEREFGYDLSRTCDEIRPTYHHVESCQETVPQAITAFLESRDFEDALRTAVSLGGDSDTLAAITGSIAEAFYGVPEELRHECRKRLPPELAEILRRWENTLYNEKGYSRI